MYTAAWRKTAYRFADLKELMAKATPLRSGDVLAGVAATNAEENVAAKMALADVPLKRFLEELVVPYEDDDITRLIIDTHDKAAFSPIAHMTVGEFRDWLLSEAATTEVLARLAPGITSEMAAATSKVMRNQDLILAAHKVEVVTRFRDTIGLKGRMAVRLQPNHPTDDRRGIACDPQCGSPPERWDARDARDRNGDGQGRSASAPQRATQRELGRHLAGLREGQPMSHARNRHRHARWQTQVEGPPFAAPCPRDLDRRRARLSGPGVTPQLHTSDNHRGLRSRNAVHRVK